jgi:hypothetical protein
MNVDRLFTGDTAMAMNRRQLLKGVSLGAGGYLLSPMLQRLEAQAAGANTTARRIVFVVEGNGLPWSQIQPRGIARQNRLNSSGTNFNRSGSPVREGLRDIPLADHGLPTALEPIAAFKNRLTVLQGLSGKMCPGGHSSGFGTLAASNSRNEPSGETIDFAVARRIPAVFPQVILGISPRPEHTIIFNSSAAGRNRALPTQCRPDLAYGALFGSVAGGNARRAFDTQRNLLDYMVDDVRRVEANLGGPERQQLQSYLQSFETMRQRHGRLVELEATLRRNAPAVTNKFRSDVETDRLDAHFDLAAATLISGLSNVVTIASGVGDLYFGIQFNGLGINLGKHGIGHGASFNGRSADELSTAIRRFHFELIARLMGRLQAAPEGNGSMLDNTLIVYLSDAAESHHSRCWEWPAVLLGNLGGRIRAGRYIEFPGHGANGHRHIGNLYTTLLHAVGDRRELFGQPDPFLGRDVDQRGPLSELLA